MANDWDEIEGTLRNLYETADDESKCAKTEGARQFRRGVVEGIRRVVRDLLGEVGLRRVVLRKRHPASDPGGAA